MTQVTAHYVDQKNVRHSRRLWFKILEFFITIFCIKNRLSVWSLQKHGRSTLTSIFITLLEDV